MASGVTLRTTPGASGMPVAVSGSAGERRIGKRGRGEQQRQQEHTPCHARSLHGPAATQLASACDTLHRLGGARPATPPGAAGLERPQPHSVATPKRGVTLPAAAMRARSPRGSA